MTRPGAALAVAALAMALATGAARAEAPKEQRDERDPGAEDDLSELTSGTWRPPPPQPQDVALAVVAFPAMLLEVAFTPIGALVAVLEDRRRGRPVSALLREDRRTVVFSPQARLSFSEGFGIGAIASFPELLGGDGRLDFSALVRLNRDYELGMRYRQSIPRLEGRTVDAAARWEIDRDLTWYGTGNDSLEENRRVVHFQVLQLLAGIDLRARGARDLVGRIEVGYRRQTLDRGEHGTIPAVDPAEGLELPPAFDLTLDFADAELVARFDSRDAPGRPSRGSFAEVRAGATTDLEGQDQRAVHGRAVVQGVRELLPDRRVLVATLGVGIAQPLGDGAEVPFHRLVILDRRRFLRGYRYGRFRDDLGWWANLEYRYPIYEYRDTGVVVESKVFADLGRVANRAENLFRGPVRYDGGVGLRVGHDLGAILDLEVALSPEGFQVGLSAGRSI